MGRHATSTYVLPIFCLFFTYFSPIFHLFFAYFLPIFCLFLVGVFPGGSSCLRGPPLISPIFHLFSGRRPSPSLGPSLRPSLPAHSLGHDPSLWPSPNLSPPSPLTARTAFRALSAFVYSSPFASLCIPVFVCGPLNKPSGNTLQS